HASGSSLAPHQFIWLLRLTNVACVGHRFTNDGSFNDATGRDLLTGNNLGGEDIVFRKVKRLEANNIRIRPPPTALKQQFVTEKIREPGVTGTVFVFKNGRCRKDRVRVLDY